ncbi:hypothetical protein OCS_01024 [Ophiocordyceps sinensis CO18]|uniref:Uncharacterized protein n=1 Tax=Ophiocordyceps sinensis (strain Co18 / CGMCC 3.14243) TaxID=911162 RepID=T5AKZ9_OPHSC|nr:hypothetical protein OCS_01024 [Ophiocordyceps sinensis CO18]
MSKDVDDLEDTLFSSPPAAAKIRRERTTAANGRAVALTASVAADKGTKGPPKSAIKYDLDLSDIEFLLKWLVNHKSKDNRSRRLLTGKLTSGLISKSTILPLKYVRPGGICIRKFGKGVFQVSSNRLAILEAKRRFQYIVDGSPIISDECFAQMTCEALVARLADPLDEFDEGYRLS